MDDRTFGELTKRVARADSRRGVVLTVVGGMAASIFGVSVRGAVAADDVEGEAFGFCRVGGFPCGRDQQCCSDKCRAGVCACAKKGKPCINRVGANCCSRKCRKGKCK